MKPLSFSLAAATFGALCLVGAGCADAPTPKPQPPSQDVSRTSCDQITAARERVNTAYATAVTAAADTWHAARDAFQNDLNQCLKDVRKGGPCDDEWNNLQKAYERAQGNISSDDAYNGYKAASAKWKACNAKAQDTGAERADAANAAEARCRDEFNAKSEAAQKAHDDAVSAAKTTRDADMATLDAIEKTCKQPKTQTGTPEPGGQLQTPGGNTGGVTEGHSAACTQTIPGANATPRTGKADDFGPKDIITNLITQIAEDVTGSPIPTDVIDNQLFAGTVCIKIRSRIAEMTIEESDAQLSSDRNTEIRLRKKLDQYRKALNVWCKIAEGRPALQDVKKDVNEINALPSGFCKTDSDCGAPTCCSATEQAQPHCNAAGACVNTIVNMQCPPPMIINTSATFTITHGR